MRHHKTMRGFATFGSAALVCGLFLGISAAPAQAQNHEGIEDESGYDGRDRDDRAGARRRGQVRGRDFDPRVYEARGRELQGEFYEIAPSANPPSWSPANGLPMNTEPGEETETAGTESGGGSFWAWAGALGLAGAAGAVGYYFWDQNQEPVQPRNVGITLNDQPE